MSDRSRGWRISTKATKLENVPSLVLFGANGGLEPFGFDTKDKRMGVVMMPFMPMELEAAMCCGSNLAEFLDNSRRDDRFSFGETA